MARSKQARAHDFTQKERAAVRERDFNECIFCRAGYRMEKTTEYGRSTRELMHYIPRSRGGLGIRQNAAVGCTDHHRMLDNGSGGEREEMLALFRGYLEGIYPDWDERELVYSKWKWAEDSNG